MAYLLENTTIPIPEITNFCRIIVFKTPYKVFIESESENKHKKYVNVEPADKKNKRRGPEMDPLEQ